MTKRIRILRISGVCILVYWINYITRNMLSVTTPEMLKEPFFTKEYTGLLSSVCFLFAILPSAVCSAAFVHKKEWTSKPTLNVNPIQTY